jgi:hypothetical protein
VRMKMKQQSLALLIIIGNIYVTISGSPKSF